MAPLSLVQLGNHRQLRAVGGLVNLVQRPVFLPAAGQIRVCDDGVADYDGVGQVLLAPPNGVIARMCRYPLPRGLMY